MKKLLNYINPLAHLGERNYSVISPLFIMILFCVLSEIFAYYIVRNPMIVGSYAIFIPIALIIYFSFREGVIGGFIASGITIVYYFYIMYSRHYTGTLLNSGLETTTFLALIYFLLAGIIGWLKQTIDQLIEKESDGRRRLEAIIQQLPVGVIITDKKGRLIHQNKQIEKILGALFPSNYTFGKDMPIFKGLLNGKTVKPSESPLVEVIANRKTITDKEYIIDIDENRKKYVQVSASAIRNKQGKIIAAAQIIADITRQKEIEKQKDDFLSMASHELKTPITSMKMFIDLQSRQLQKSDPEKAKYFNSRIKDQADRLKELTNDLLDVSRIQTGKLRFSKEECNLTEIVKDTVEGLLGATSKHTIVLKSSSKCLISGDKYRIYQVLVNLITNAIKYSPNGHKNKCRNKEK
ncbi:MAG: sensor histidine kinase [Candidatus Levyibacteriota bacterium]